eukprot:ANDGO_07872.mRNA.1 hypothetical protein AMSG_11887
MDASIQFFESFILRGCALDSWTYHAFWARCRRDPVFATRFASYLVARLVLIFSPTKASAASLKKKHVSSASTNGFAASEVDLTLVSDIKRLLTTPGNAPSLDFSDDLYPHLSCLFTHEHNLAQLSAESRLPDAEGVLMDLDLADAVPAPAMYVPDKCRRPSYFSMSFFLNIVPPTEQNSKDAVLLSEIALKHAEEKPRLWRRLLHTLMLCVLSMNIDRLDFGLLNAISNIPGPLRSVPPMELVLRFLSSGSLTSRSYFLVDFLTNTDGMVGSYFSMCVTEDITMPHVSSMGLVWPHLEREALRSLDAAATLLPSIFNVMIQFLNHPFFPQTRLLPTLFFLQYSLKMTPLPVTMDADAEDLLDRLEKAVKRYSLWPQPYGVQAMDCIQLLRKERMLGGFARRSHISSVFSNFEGHRVFVLLNQSAKGSAAFLRHMRYAKDAWTVQFARDSRACLLDLAARLSVSSVVVNYWTSPDVDSCAALSHIHDRLQDVSVVGRSVEEFRSECRSIVESSYMPSTSSSVSFTASGSFEIEVIPLEAEPDLQIRPRIYKTQIESVHLHALKKIIDRYATPEDTISPNAEVRNVYVALAGGDGTIQHFATAYVALYSQLKHCRLQLRLMLLPIGRRNTVSSYLAQVDGLYRRHVHLPFQFASMPVPDLSSDGVVAPIAPSPTDSPAMSPSGSSERLDDGVVEQVTPGEKFEDMWKALLKEDSSGGLMSQLNISPSAQGLDVPALTASYLIRYALFSTQTLTAYIHRCECWSLGSSGRKEVLMIPFVSFAQLGVTAEALRIQKSSMPYLPVGDIATQKNFRFIPPECKLTYTLCDSTGTPLRQDVVLPLNSYNSITLTAVSHFSDRMRVSSHPQQPWLQCVALPSQSTKDNRSDSDRARSVKALKVEPPENGSELFVVLDGELFGPFQKLRFSTYDVPGAQDEQLFLPVQHFRSPDI